MNKQLLESISLYISEYWVYNYTSPTIREMCEEFGINSTSYIYKAILELERRGEIIYFRGRKARAVPSWVQDAIARDVP